MTEEGALDDTLLAVRDQIYTASAELWQVLVQVFNAPGSWCFSLHDVEGLDGEFGIDAVVAMTLRKVQTLRRLCKADRFVPQDVYGLLDDVARSLLLLRGDSRMSGHLEESQRFGRLFFAWAALLCQYETDG